MYIEYYCGNSQILKKFADKYFSYSLKHRIFFSKGINSTTIIYQIEEICLIISS